MFFTRNASSIWNAISYGLGLLKKGLLGFLIRYMESLLHIKYSLLEENNFHAQSSNEILLAPVGTRPQQAG
jgi:hypothetical protein